MKKQIEEMAHLVCGMASKPNSCRECGGRKGGCFTIPHMELLYNAGYRKQSEVARKIFEEIENLLVEYSHSNSSISSVFVDHYFDGAIEFRIAELKKKYIGE